MNTLERVKGLAAQELSLDAATLDPAKPIGELGIDSLAFVEFVFKLEDELGVRITDEDLRAIKTIGDLVRHIEASGKPA